MALTQVTYDSEQRGILQTAYYECCRDLGVAATDTASRNRIANALMHLSRVGQTDIHRLKVYARSRYLASRG